MGGINFDKIKSITEARAIISHIGRYDQNNNVNYKNVYIQREKMAQNYTIGGAPCNCSAEYNKLKNRLNFIDKQQPPARVRSDRVLFGSYVVYAPEDLPNEQQKEFFEMVYNKLAEFSGGVENITNGYIHNDEIHEYIDPLDKMKKTSRGHMHLLGLPYTKDKGINGKSFFTKSRFIKLNKDIEQECFERFGVHFNNGGKCLGLSVEELQKRSEDEAISLGIKEYIDNLNKTNDINKIINNFAKIKKYDMLRKKCPDELAKLEQKYIDNDKDIKKLNNLIK